MLSLKQLVTLPWQPLVAIPIGLTSILAPFPQAAMAQYGGVPIVDRQGDYATALMQGNLGYYGNAKWLIVEDELLNCRVAPNGAVRSRILAGAIVTAAFRGPVNKQRLTEVTPEMDAIVFENGSPWLRIQGIAAGLAFPPEARSASQQFKPGECYIRANRRYIAPINIDAKLN